MNSQLTLDRSVLELALENSPGMADETAQDLASYHDSLMASYLSYLKSAGYSRFASNIGLLERSARRFLSKFPDPQL